MVSVTLVTPANVETPDVVTVSVLTLRVPTPTTPLIPLPSPLNEEAVIIPTVCTSPAALVVRAVPTWIAETNVPTPIFKLSVSTVPPYNLPVTFKSPLRVCDDAAETIVPATLNESKTANSITSDSVAPLTRLTVVPSDAVKSRPCASRTPFL